jgi:hypothetical protein
MRLSKWYLVVCVAAFFTSFMTVRADDTPAQAAARTALEEKLHELDTQQAPTNAQTPTPATPEQPAQPAATAPPTAQQPVVVTPSGATTREPTNQSAPAITMPSTPPPAEKPTMTTAPSVAPAKATASSAPTASSSGNSFFRPVPPPSGGIPAGAALEVEQNVPSSTMSTAPTAAQTPAPVAAQSVPMEPSQTVNASYPGKQLGLQPIVAPPLPISVEQQAQLQALLARYDANAITPEQYQIERAKILAGHQ